jgi:N-acetylglucosamine kinase-like BadF-type ATPase
VKQLIIDCGATKADWCVLENKTTRTVRTRGFNLFQTSEGLLSEIIGEAAAQIGPGVEDIHLYAAGLLEKPATDFNKWFPGAQIEYASDMLGAARAVCGHNPGIAAILGTGANTCEFDGTNIGWKVNCGGYILGDEGSGAVLGKLFITDYIKNYMPEELLKEVKETYPELDYLYVVRKVYGGEAPARYLGSFAPFVLERYGKYEYVKELVEGNFKNLFEKTLKQYKPLPVGVVGGFGYAAREILQRMGKEYGVTFSKFLATPAEGLAEYHAL